MILAMRFIGVELALRILFFVITALCMNIFSRVVWLLVFLALVGAVVAVVVVATGSSADVAIPLAPARYGADFS